MPGEKKESFPFVPTSTIALALVGVAYILYQPPLESVRPGATDLRALESGEERVQARLWQDPFLSVTDHKKGEKDGDFKLMAELQAGILRIEVNKERTTEHHQITRLTTQFEEEGQTAVMMVMTDGSPSAEGHEQRLRDRNAVLSALGVACFAPSDPEHIGYFKLPPTSLSGINLQGDEEVVSNYLKIVPYEWLEHRKLRACGEKGKIHDRVLVLWFQEDDLGNHPLKTLSNVWKQLIQKTDKTPSLVILGPRSSSGLRTMVEGVLNEPTNLSPTKKNGNSSLFTRVPEVNLWSPWATVDNDLLVYNLKELIREKKQCVRDGKNNSLEEPTECVRSIFKGEKVNLFRTIPSDRKLVQTLLEELRRRNKVEERHKGNDTADDKKGKIAIVSEWDTFYGRSFPLELRREICFQREENMQGCATPMEALETFINDPTRDEDSGVLRYSYLRGLDGKVPGKDQDQTNRKGKEAPTVKESIRSIGLGEMERPVGESQLDYIRRLAGVILERDNKEKDNCGFWAKVSKKCWGIEAIGVTGSDVYDKFLVLQALRQRLPDKVFFTTDLDARYSDPEQIKWTRNLIVASHFGLRLHEQIQRDVPPFRETTKRPRFTVY